MSIPHLDPCLNPTRYETTFTPLPNTNFNGEYTLNVISSFEEDFRKTIVADTITNPLSLAVNKYGDTFYDAANSLNSDFLKRPYVLSKIPDYDLLSERLKNGRTITTFEFAQFISDYSYTPGAVADSYNADPNKFLNELDGFYRGDFVNNIMGGFCSLFGNVFGAIQGFFDIVGSIQGLIGDALSFIAKIKNIKNPLLAIFNAVKVKALIEAIKEKISKVIEGVINKVKSAIENFNPANIMSQVQSFITNNIGKRIAELKENIGKFFTEENTKYIKDKITGLIDYSTSLFENPSLEEITFMIARFCGFAAGVQGVLQGLKDPLDDFSNRYEEVFNTISNASNRVLGESIRAGAIRIAPERREEVINTLRDEWQQAGSLVPIDGNERNGVPEWDDLLNGKDPDLSIVGQWVTHPLCGREGWTMMDLDFRVKIMRLHKAAKAAEIYSGKLILNSGYRSQQYNALVGGELTSKHIDGMAADLTWNGFSPYSQNVLRFANLARGLGITGRGFYKTFIHTAISNENFDRRG